MFRVESKDSEKYPFPGKIKINTPTIMPCSIKSSKPKH